LSLMPAFLRLGEVDDLHARLESMARLVDDKEGVIESFKSHNAVLRNSQRFLPVAARALSDRVPPSADVDQRLHLLLSTLMQLDTPRESEVSDEAKAAIDALRAWQPDVTSPEQRALAQDIDVLLQHAAIVAERKPILDALVDRALTVPITQTAAELEDVYSAYYSAALQREDKRQKILFATAAVVVVLGLIEVILGLRRGRAALERATLELRSANLALAIEREKERELGELKTRFVAMVAHEFRNPVAVILSSSELLERYGEKWDGSRRLNHFESIRGAAQSLTQLLDEILLIGRAEAGLLRPHAGRVNLRRMCEELVLTMTRTLGVAHRVKRTFSGDEEAVLDERLLRHLLSNLLENAIKYSPDESEIELGVDSSASEIRFSVKDRGIGIPAEDMPELFSTFHRGANVGRIRGSGLGLAVVKHVVEAQDGTLDVKSEVGRGTEVVVVLPKQRPASEAPPSSGARLEAS
ncbi:MAG TPA: DAHL domain-containing protein, partial [Polyangiaceae bacterium]